MRTPLLALPVLLLALTGCGGGSSSLASTDPQGAKACNLMAKAFADKNDATTAIGASTEAGAAAAGAKAAGIRGAVIDLAGTGMKVADPEKMVAACRAAGVTMPNVPASAPDTTPSASPTGVTGQAAYLSFAHGASFGSKDFVGASDESLLSIGQSVCDGFGSRGLSSAQLIQGLTESSAAPTDQEAGYFVAGTVRTLCPQYTAKLTS